MNKECKVIRLPTHDFDAPIFKGLEKFGEDLITNLHNDSPVYFKDCQYYHLYIVSGDEIEKDDWIYDTVEKSVRKTSDEEVKYFNNVRLGKNTGHLRLRIVATTNCNLYDVIEARGQTCPLGLTDSDATEKVYLPGLSNEFIEEYVRLGGHIENVFVEYGGFEMTSEPAGMDYDYTCPNCHRTSNLMYSSSPTYCYDCEGKLKVSKDNKIDPIILQPIWRREEIVDIVNNLRDAIEKGESRWNHKMGEDDTPPESQSEMEGYHWALNDILNEITSNVK